MLIRLGGVADDVDGGVAVGLGVDGGCWGGGEGWVVAAGGVDGGVTVGFGCDCTGEGGHG